MKQGSAQNRLNDIAAARETEPLLTRIASPKMRETTHSVLDSITDLIVYTHQKVAAAISAIWQMCLQKAPASGFESDPAPASPIRETSNVMTRPSTDQSPSTSIPGTRDENSYSAGRTVIPDYSYWGDLYNPAYDTDLNP